MNEEQRSLLNRVLRSQYFYKAPALRKILEYVCEKTADPGATPVKEYEIAVEALDRRESFDPKIDPIVRVNIASIRERLGSFFSSEGMSEELRLVIPKGEYRAVFYDAGPLSTLSRVEEVEKQNLERFWQPYLIGSVKNVLLFTELLFLRDGSGNLVRNIYCNDQSKVHKNILNWLPSSEFAGYFPSFHYVSSGEMLFTLHLTGMFARLGVDLKPSNARFESWHSLSEANLILTGSSRTNSFLDALQGSQNFVITDDRILNLDPAEGELPFYKGAREYDSKLETLTEYALITRKPGLNQGCVFTTISANHGRAIEGAGEFLTNDLQMGILFEKLHFSSNGDQKLPKSFQFLLRIKMYDHDEEIVSVEYVTHRILEQ